MGCVAAVRDALKACEGVKDVKIDFERKIATAIVEEESANSEKLLAAVIEAGYEDTKIK